MFLVSLVLDIILNTPTFKFFTTSGTHILGHGSLILLQLSLHLLVLILKGENAGSSLLTLIIFGPTFHSLLIIEIQLNEFAPIKVDKIDNPAKNAFLMNPNIFIVFYYFSLNTYECLKYHQLQ